MSDSHSHEILSNTDTAYHPNAVYDETKHHYIPVTLGQQIEHDAYIVGPRTGLLSVGYYKKQNYGRKFANPASAGLFVLATSLFTLGLILCQAHSVTNPAILSGAFFFSSGLIEIITGIWCIATDNVFGSVLLLCLGGFFASFGAIVTDVFGVADQYATAADLDNALGIYLSSWTVFGFILWTATFKSTIPIVVLLFCVWFFMLLYTIATFNGSEGVKVASGVFCFIASMCAFYAGYDGLTTVENSYAAIPEWKYLRMPGSWKKPEIEEAPVAETV